MKIRLLFLMNALLLVTSPNAVLAEEKQKLPIDNDTFTCLKKMKRVGHFFVANLLDNLDATVAVAKSDTGGVYPVGSVVQLVPGEVMVKHPKGVSPATKDWEFFELDVSKSGSVIKKRGFADVNNQFGDNCFACHIKAKPQWDLICDNSHGCDPIPLSRDMIALIQKTDPRCKPKPILSKMEKRQLMMLKQRLEAAKREAEKKAQQ